MKPSTKSESSIKNNEKLEILAKVNLELVKKDSIRILKKVLSKTLEE